MTTAVRSPLTAMHIPDRPDIARMRRETGQRLRDSMARNGADVLLLLGNSNVAYATGVSWPLGDSGLAHVDRPVAVVLADDPVPHLFMPFREGRRRTRTCPRITSTARCTSSTTRACRSSPPSWPTW